MDLIVVDCQNDFIDGSLACENANEAVENIIKIFPKFENVYYTKDSHPKNHMSFENFGGLWKEHCVEGERGSKLSEKFYDTKFSPNEKNTFLKGRNKDEEEYSGFSAKNKFGEKLSDIIGKEIYIAGIASEFCVRNTAEEFKKSGRKVVVLKNLLGYVNKENHEKNLEEMKEMEIEIR